MEVTFPRKHFALGYKTSLKTSIELEENELN